MGKNSQKKDVKRARQTSYKSGQALRNSLQGRKRSVRKEEKLSTCASSVEQYFDISSNCYSLLKDMCVHAALFQRHSHRGTLLASDIHKASDLYLLKKHSNFIDKTGSNVELSAYVEKTFQVKEAEKTFYYGKCLNCPEFTDLKDVEADHSLKDYFKLTMKAVFVNNSEFFSLVLSDLKRNLGILPILPVFIHDLCNDAFLLKYKPAHLKKILLVIHSLYLNPNLYFQNDHLHKILDFIIACAIENLNFEDYQQEDVLSLQDTSAEILHDIFIKNQAISSQVYNYILKKLTQPYKETEFQLISCCGSLTVAHAMGLSALTSILPLIFLNSSMKEQNILNKLTKRLNSNDMSTERYAKTLQSKLFEASQSLVEYSLHKALALPHISKLYTIASDHDKISKSKIKGPPLMSDLCCSILKYYGETMSTYLPLLLNASDEAIPLIDIFEEILQQESARKTELT
ncbi:uncharacterized protein [Parasteatoda tepidariorum]|uniref:uncharacterized protein isoform X1 n=2 Tax=Parasteatoda tepidariorum TaxID=114398 RepID=UPI001C71A54A|nr:uncharacterized protein LOC107446937 isoform X1 [Parasteatoda tepidariorum]